MTTTGLLFLGGNGHGPVRLAPARRELARRESPFELRDLAYARVASFDHLLDALARDIDRHPTAVPLYATGIGGLVALALRARGELRHRPLVLQGAVLWGLERRWFPRLMRIGPAARLLPAVFRSRRFQDRFATKHFQGRPNPELLRGFFEGYGDAAAFAAWFRWLTPRLLRDLERELGANRAALADLECWWGEKDSVVGLEELRVTERALGVELPLRTFPEWGHYPMIDDPAGWVSEVSRVVETALAPA
jgi:hypothetical protein